MLSRSRKTSLTTLTPQLFVFDKNVAPHGPSAPRNNKPLRIAWRRAGVYPPLRSNSIGFFPFAFHIDHVKKRKESPTVSQELATLPILEADAIMVVDAEAESRPNPADAAAGVPFPDIAPDPNARR